MQVGSLTAVTNSATNLMELAEPSAGSEPTVQLLALSMLAYAFFKQPTRAVQVHSQINEVDEVRFTDPYPYTANRHHSGNFVR